MNFFEIGMLVFTGISAIGIPFIGLFMHNADKERTAIHDHVKHLDDCIDELKKLILGKGVTRNDFDMFRVEANESLTRVRQAISQDTHGLHERLMRLETIQLERK